MAARLAQAPVIDALGPRWEPPDLDANTTYGLLVIEGLIGRRVRVGRGISTELLGPGDILRPWDEPCMSNLVPPGLDYRVFRPSRLAVLDQRITSLIGRRPELTIAFSGRLLRRARYAEFLLAVSHLGRVEQRLLATLWHLASVWGRVTPDGTLIPLSLTHEVLGEIVGAQRSSVSTAMTRLEVHKQVVRMADGRYVLTGDPAEWDEAS